MMYKSKHRNKSVERGEEEIGCGKELAWCEPGRVYK